MKKSFLLVALIFIFWWIIAPIGCQDTKQTFGCDCEDKKTMVEYRIIDNNTPSTTISVYNKTGDYVADASCHCWMRVTFRWGDDERAKTDERPPVTYTFQAAGGNVYFPSNPANEKVETNSDGTKQWTLSISEAQDKNLHEGTSYGIVINYNKDYDPPGGVVCTGELEFKYYSEDAYETGCEVNSGDFYTMCELTKNIQDPVLKQMRILEYSIRM